MPLIIYIPCPVINTFAQFTIHNKKDYIIIERKKKQYIRFDKKEPVVTRQMGYKTENHVMYLLVLVFLFNIFVYSRILKQTTYNTLGRVDKNHLTIFFFYFYDVKT